MLAGCSGSGGASSQDTHIKKVTDLYISCVAANQGRRPPNEAALKQYAKRLSPELLAVMGIDDVDAIFVSPRDSQPYVVAYATANASGPILAYERDGADGKRLVSTREGAVQELEEAEFQRLLSMK
jgi:hypothetical protein